MTETKRPETDYERAARKEAEALAEKVENFVNAYGCDCKSFAKRLASDKTHRSLQGQAMRLFMTFVAEMAAEGKGHDLRNEPAIELAKAIMALPSRLHYLPLG